MSQYYPRLIDTVLRKELEAFGAVLLTGPKWCGKTTTARQLAKSVLYMQDPDNQENYQQLASIRPSLLLQGEHPRLIDEWQLAPQLWDAVRHDVDMQGKDGLYILTGSTSVDENQIKHSGAGRISRLYMHTMSLYESGHSNGSVRLHELFQEGKFEGSISPLNIEDYAKLITRGGWPHSVGKSDEAAIRQVAGYCDAIVKSDIRTVDNVSRDEDKARAILRAYSRHISTQATATTILDDIQTNHGSMHHNTLEDYLNAFRKLYVITEVPAWSPQLRSRTAIRTSNTRHFADPAIASYFLKAFPDDLLFDMNTFGLLFESLAVRDIKTYSQFLDGTISHYRDKSGLEVDIILHLQDGRWAAVEVKLGSRMVDEAAANLIKFRDKIDVDRMRAPSFLMVVTGTEYAYRREDGVYVVPLGCLKP
jgi:uncharacterized protein